MDSKIMGIYLLDDKRFYYLETGPGVVGNALDKLKMILTARGILRLFPLPGERNITYKIMSLLDAKRQSYEIEAVYVNPHVEKVVKQKAKSKTSTGSGWLRD